MSTDARPVRGVRPEERDPAWDLFDLLPAGIAVIDSRYTVLYWNACLAQWTGIPGEVIVGSDIRKRFTNLASPVYTSRIDQVFTGGPAAVFSSQFHPHFIPAPLPNGELLAEHASVIPFDGNGERLGLVVIEDIHDLTSQVKMYRATRKLADDEIAERKAAQEALKAANAKLNLLSSITRHDILNQITAITSYLFLLEQSLAPGSQQQEYVEKISRQVGMVTRFLEIAREYERLGVAAPKWCSVRPIVERSAADVFAGSVELDNTLPDLEVYADQMFEKVIYNIFENAKFHGDHVTRIGAGFAQTEGPGIFTIEDNGAGVPEEDKTRIFLKGVGTRTGLGLYLSKEILSITGLEIRETGTPEKGARFEILVPRKMYRLRE